MKKAVLLLLCTISIGVQAQFSKEGINGYSALEKGDFQQAYNEFIKGYKNGDNFLCAWGIGDLYHYGFVVEHNEQSAFYYYMIAANNGNPQAQYYVGIYYENGTGVSQDMCKAKEWYMKAASNKTYKDVFFHDIYSSANNVAFILASGACDGKENLELAAKYYRQAAEGEFRKRSIVLVCFT